MPSSIDYITLSKHRLLLLTSYQAFSMCLYDVDAIRSGKTIGYGLDGYDLCRFLFPESFFLGKRSPHYHQIKSTWEGFFQRTDGETTFGIISPFALLEILSTIEERASTKLLHTMRGLSEIRDLVKDLAQGIRDLEQVVPEHKKTIATIHSLMKTTEGARKAILEGGPFETLKSLLQGRKIYPLDSIVTTARLSNLLSYDNQENLARGLQYLNYRREKAYSDYSVFYNTLDIYHYVLFHNIEILLEPKNIQAYISSSGLFSRNSWFLTKYGKFPDDLAGIPNNWSARSSDVPAYLTKALSHFNFDLSQIRDFFEEGRSLARVILRDLREIPQISNSITDPTERMRLGSRNPTLEISNKILRDIVRLQNDYYRFVFPEFKESDMATSDISADIDFRALYDWMTNPDTRTKEFHHVANQVQQQIKSLSLLPLDWTMYIAPLGDVAYDILKSFDPDFNVHIR